MTFNVKPDKRLVLSFSANLSYNVRLIWQLNNWKGILIDLMFNLLNCLPSLIRFLLLQGYWLFLLTV